MNHGNRSLLLMIFSFLALFTFTPAFAAACGVSVYGLNVEDSEIVGYVENTGNETDLISYGFYVNDGAVRTGSFVLNVSESRRIEHAYSFGHGEYDIELIAVADCGASDGELIVYNVLESYMCGNPYGLDGEDYCDYTHRRYMVCQDGDWIVEAVNEGEYCYNCDACGDDICNCGETANTCWSDCGNICTPEYLDTYRCNGDWRQRFYRNSNCEYEWRDWEICDEDCVNGHCADDYYDDDYYDDCTTLWMCKDNYHRGYRNSDCSWSSIIYCPDGCVDGYCRGEGYDDDCTTGWMCRDDDYRGYRNSDCSWSSLTRCTGRCVNGYCRSDDHGYEYCGVSIENVDYASEVSEGSPAWIRVTMKNTGRYRETLTAKIYIDDSYWAGGKEDLNAGSKTTKSFNFYLQKGSHNIKVEVVDECGSRDSERFTLNVMGSGSQPAQGCNYNGVCEYGESYQTCPHDCPGPEPSPGYTTSVDIHPASLDIENCGTGTVSIDITSIQRQTFTISVSGVPEEWVSYPGSLEVGAGKKRVYLYITPEEAGTGSLEVTVRANSEGKEFTETVEFYVSPDDRPGGSSGMTGFITAAQTNLIAVIVVIVVVVTLVLYIGFRRIRPEEEFSEPGPKSF